MATVPEGHLTVARHFSGGNPAQKRKQRAVGTAETLEAYPTVNWRSIIRGAYGTESAISRRRYPPGSVGSLFNWMSDNLRSLLLSA